MGFWGFLIGTFCIFHTFEAWNSANIAQYCVLNGSYKSRTMINDVRRVWDHRYSSNSYFTQKKQQKIALYGSKKPAHIQDIKTMKTAWVMDLNPYFSYPTIEDYALVAGQDQILTLSERLDLGRKAISLVPYFTFQSIWIGGNKDIELECRSLMF